MRSILVFISLLAACILWPADVSLSQCPEDPNDNGICDTMYVEVYECDSLFAGEAKQVRLPIRVTNDIPDPVIDSIAGIVIPLHFNTSNSSAQCFIDPFYNLCGAGDLIPFPTCDRSVFRHLPDNATALEHNWMMDLAMEQIGLEWNLRVLDLSTGTDAWLSLVPMGVEDQRFRSGSRVLLATLFFTVDDTMTICLDSCFWPPGSRLAFSRADAVTYVPRTNLPYCFSMSYPGVGDCNADCMVDVGDVVYLIDYLFRDGNPPFPVDVGDANCDGFVDLGDLVFLINYLYKGGPPPSC